MRCARAVNGRQHEQSFVPSLRATLAKTGIVFHHLGLRRQQVEDHKETEKRKLSLSSGGESNKQCHVTKAGYMLLPPRQISDVAAIRGLLSAALCSVAVVSRLARTS